MRKNEINPTNRPSALEERRRLKMARSAHAYVRGSTQHFYKWLIAESGQKLPDGPPIWICGDCHAGNLGPVASADGIVEIQSRDLDQTVVGNPTHDLIRLGLSLTYSRPRIGSAGSHDRSDARTHDGRLRSFDESGEKCKNLHIPPKNCGQSKRCCGSLLSESGATWPRSGLRM